MDCEWLDKIFSPQTGGFEERALEVFRFQYGENPLYHSYCKALGRSPENVGSLPEIPFLPISFFKSHPVTAGEFSPELVFQSSGTTGMVRSRHLVKDARFYETSYRRGFEAIYGPVTHWRILALLPSYLEQGGSSLVYMVEGLIQKTGHPESGFYLYDHDELAAALRASSPETPTLLIGVTYALLDFARSHSMPLHHTIVMETGGMKGRMEEMTRGEVHERLKKAFSLSIIHSEYGMTELLSQAYSTGEGLFQCPPWMKVMVREEEDPLSIRFTGSGALNIIDLANLYSCSFIATDDAGKVSAQGEFEVLGRLDNSDIRGCSLLTL